MKTTQLLGELQRRRVYQVVIGYAITGWLVVQVATQVFPAFEIPTWGQRLVVVLVTLGFPIAVVLAWSFDLTGRGVERTRSHPADTNIGGRSIESARELTPPWREGLNRGILEMALDGIITINAAGLVCEFNPAAERTFGFSALDVIGREMAELIIPPAYRERHRMGLQHYLKTGEGPVIGRRIEIPALHKDGTEMLIELAISALEIGGASYFTAYVRDITTRARGEEALRRLAAIVESSQDAIMSEDLQGTITSWNDASTQLFGYTSEEVIGKSVTILTPPERRDEDARLLARAQRGDHINHYETVRQRSDGNHFHSSLTISPIKNSSNHVTGASIIVRDISETVQNNRRRSALYRVASLLAGSSSMAQAARPVVETIAKMDNWIFGALWLYEEEDASLQCYTSWRAPLPQLSAFEKVTNEMKLPRSIGLPGRVVVSREPAWITDLMQDSNFPRNPQALEAGLRSGFAFPTCAEGVVNGVVELYSAQSVAPDKALLGAVEALGNQIGIFVHRSRTQIDLELTRLARSKLELHLHMADVHRLLRRVARRVRARFDPLPPFVHLRLDARHHHAFVDVPRLEQVFEYILANAFRFGGNGIPIVVSTTNHSTEELCIKIADGGVGIEPRYLETVFNPFEQVGPREEGLGLGLAMSKTLINLHGGTIRAESDGLGRGTTIVVGLRLDCTHADIAA